MFIIWLLTHKKTKYKILSHSTNNFTQFDLECYGQTRIVFVMFRLVFVKLRKLKNLMNGGSLVSSEINTLNLNLSLRLNLRFNLKLNLIVSLKLNLNLKLNLGLKFETEFFFFLSGFSFMNIYDWQRSRQKGKLFL